MLCLFNSFMVSGPVGVTLSTRQKSGCIYLVLVQELALGEIYEEFA